MFLHESKFGGAVDPRSQRFLCGDTSRDPRPHRHSWWKWKVDSPLRATVELEPTPNVGFRR